MSCNSSIEWTDATWNPVTGCTPISSGCQNCYAERLARRLQAMGNPNYANGFAVTLHYHMLSLPLRWRASRNIFVNSMSDLFHDDVPDEFIVNVFEVMNQATWHRFQVLTKRSERLVKLSPRLVWSTNIWMGVTVENEEVAYRADHLRATGAQTKFLSCEPLLGEMRNLDLTGIDWVIVGGESGPGARPMNEQWVKDIRDLCMKKHVPFFFKQWGGYNKKKAGRLLEGRTWDAFPTVATS